MDKLRAETLCEFAEEARRRIAHREATFCAKITVHLEMCGIAAGAKSVLVALKVAAVEKDARDVMVRTSGCAGLCSREPTITVQLRGEAPVLYCDLNPEKARRVFSEHVMGGSVISEWALAIGNKRAL